MSNQDTVFTLTFDSAFGTYPADKIRESTEELADKLPEYMPNSSHSDNYKLLEPIGRQVALGDIDIDNADDALTVQNAKTIDQLEKLGALVGIKHRDGETKAHYRARIQAEYALSSSQGTVADSIEAAASILDTTINNIEYSEQGFKVSSGEIALEMPGRAIDDSSLSEDEIAELMERVIPASYSVNGIRSGTFTYITPTEYTNNEIDPELGYDGLDNGSPKDNGGTYAGLLS